MPHLLKEALMKATIGTNIKNEEIKTQKTEEPVLEKKEDPSVNDNPKEISHSELKKILE
jgi:hypothetical protein